MSYWTIIPNAIKFTVVIAVAMAFFSKTSTMGLMNELSIRSDVIASSMSFVNMHENSRVNITWDHSPFTIAVTEGSLILVFQTKDAAVSPYPLTIPIDGSEEIEESYYYADRNVAEFGFRNEGEPEVFALKEKIS